MPYVRLDGTPLQEAIVGLRRTGMIIRCHGNVLKIPCIYRNPCASSDEKEIEAITAEENCMFLENEKEVYHRLGHHHGIINVIKILEEGIKMAYIKNGSLFQYLQVQEPPHHLPFSGFLDSQG